MFLCSRCACLIVAQLYLAGFTHGQLSASDVPAWVEPMKVYCFR